MIMITMEHAYGFTLNLILILILILIPPPQVSTYPGRTHNI